MKIEAEFQRRHGERLEAVPGSVRTLNYSESLDTWKLVFKHQGKIDIRPYDFVSVFLDGKKEAEMLVDTTQEKMMRNSGEVFYDYTVSLMSETKLLEKIQLPNRSFTHAVGGNPRDMYAVIQDLMGYVPKLRTDGDPVPLVSLTDSVRAKFSGVSCKDLSMSHPTLRQALTAVMSQAGCIPLVTNRELGFIDFNADTAFNANLLNTMDAEQYSNSSDSYVNSLVTNASDVLDDNEVTETLIGFRNRTDGILRKRSNLAVNTALPIYRVNKMIMRSYGSVVYRLYNRQVSNADGSANCFSSFRVSRAGNDVTFFFTPNERYKNDEFFFGVVNEFDVRVVAFNAPNGGAAGFVKVGESENWEGMAGAQALAIDEPMPADYEPTGSIWSQSESNSGGKATSSGAFATGTVDYTGPTADRYSIKNIIINSANATNDSGEFPTPIRNPENYISYTAPSYGLSYSLTWNGPLPATISNVKMTVNIRQYKETDGSYTDSAERTYTSFPSVGDDYVQGADVTLTYDSGVTIPAGGNSADCSEKITDTEHDWDLAQIKSLSLDLSNLPSRGDAGTLSGSVSGKTISVNCDYSLDNPAQARRTVDYTWTVVLRTFRRASGTSEDTDSFTSPRYSGTDYQVTGTDAYEGTVTVDYTSGATTVNFDSSFDVPGKKINIYSVKIVATGLANKGRFSDFRANPTDSGANLFATYRFGSSATSGGQAVGKWTIEYELLEAKEHAGEVSVTFHDVPEADYYALDGYFLDNSEHYSAYVYANTFIGSKLPDGTTSVLTAGSYRDIQATDAGVSEFDITPLVKEAGQRKLLSYDQVAMGNETTLAGLAKYYYSTVEYSIGGTEITGWSNNYSIAVGWWTEDHTVAENILDFLSKQSASDTSGKTTRDLFLINDWWRVGGNESFYSNIVATINYLATSDTVDRDFDGTYAVAFDISYQPMNELNFRSLPDDLSEIGFPLEQLDSKENGLANFSDLASVERDKVNRLGKGVTSFMTRYDGTKGIIGLGARGDANGQVVFKEQISYWPNSVSVNYFLCRDYVIANYSTSIMTKYRSYQYIDYRQATARNESRVCYLAEGETEDTGNAAVLNCSLAQAFFPFVCVQDKLPVMGFGFRRQEAISYGNDGASDLGAQEFSTAVSKSYYSRGVAFVMRSWDNISFGNWIETSNRLEGRPQHAYMAKPEADGVTFDVGTFGLGVGPSATDMGNVASPYFNLTQLPRTSGFYGNELKSKPRIEFTTDAKQDQSELFALTEQIMEAADSDGFMATELWAKSWFSGSLPGRVYMRTGVAKPSKLTSDPHEGTGYVVWDKSVIKADGRTLTSNENVLLSVRLLPTDPDAPQTITYRDILWVKKGIHSFGLSEWPNGLRWVLTGSVPYNS